MTRDEQIEAVVSRLQIPSALMLADFGYISKLIDNPGSIIFIAIEEPFGENGPRVGKGWFSARERELLRKALKQVNERRAKAGEKLTTEPPCTQNQSEPSTEQPTDTSG